MKKEGRGNLRKTPASYVLTPAQRRLVKSQLPTNPPVGARGSVCDNCGLRGHTSNVCAERESGEEQNLTEDERLRILEELGEDYQEDFLGRKAERKDEQSNHIASSEHPQRQRETSTQPVQDATSAAAVQDSGRTDGNSQDKQCEDDAEGLEKSKEAVVHAWASSQQRFSGKGEQGSQEEADIASDVPEYDRERTEAREDEDSCRDQGGDGIQQAALHVEDKEAQAHFGNRESESRVDKALSAVSSGTLELVELVDAAVQADGNKGTDEQTKELQAALDEADKKRREAFDSSEKERKRAEEAEQGNTELQERLREAERLLEEESERARVAEEAIQNERNAREAAENDLAAQRKSAEDAEQRAESAELQLEESRKSLRNEIERWRQERDAEKEKRFRAEEVAEDAKATYEEVRDEARLAREEAEQAKQQSEASEERASKAEKERDEAKALASREQRERKRAVEAEQKLAAAWEQHIHFGNLRHQHEAEAHKHQQWHASTAVAEEDPGHVHARERQRFVREAQEAVKREKRKAEEAASEEKLAAKRAERQEEEACFEIIAAAPEHLKQRGLAFRAMLLGVDEDSDESARAVAQILERAYNVCTRVKPVVRTWNSLVRMCACVFVVVEWEKGVASPNDTAQAVLRACREESRPVHAFVASSVEEASKNVFRGLSEQWQRRRHFEQGSRKSLAVSCFRDLGVSDNALKSLSPSPSKQHSETPIGSPQAEDATLQGLRGEQGAWDIAYFVERCSGLRRIHLIGCDRSVVSRAFESALESSCVEKFSFGGAQLSLGPLRALNRKETTTLRLTFTGTLREEDAALVAASSLAESERVTVVVTESGRISEAAVGPLTQFAMRMPNIERAFGVPVGTAPADEFTAAQEPDEDHCKGTGLCAATIVRFELEKPMWSSVLTRLDLSGLRLGPKGGVHVAEALEQCNKAVHLAGRGGGLAASGVGRLVDAMRDRATSMDLPGNDCGDEGAKRIASAWRDGMPLKRLCLGRNSIGTAGARALAAALPCSAETLTELRLDRNSIGDKGVAALASGLSRSCFPAMGLLDLGHNFSLSSHGMAELAGALTSSAPGLRTLSLGRSALGEEGARHVSRLLKSLSKLEMLDLELCQLREKGAQAIGEGIAASSSLASVSMARNGLGDRGAAALCHGLASAPCIEWIDLSSNAIGTQGARALGRALTGKHGEVHLRLRGNLVPPEEVTSAFPPSIRIDERRQADRGG